MANTLLLKKSGQADETPSAGEMSHGELAINYADGKLFFKNSGNSVVEFLSSPGTSAGQVLFSNGRDEGLIHGMGQDLQRPVWALWSLRRHSAMCWASRCWVSLTGPQPSSTRLSSAVC